MEVARVDERRHHSGVAQYVQQRVAELVRVPNGVLPVLRLQKRLRL